MTVDLAAEVPKSTLVEWDDRYVWHPFTPHDVFRDEDPLMIVAGEGNELIDADGRRLLDGVASIWCNVFGHRRPEIDEAIRQQLDRIAHATFLGNSSGPAVRLAKRLVEVAPDGLTRCFFSDDGSTAVEVALKMALQFHRQSQPGPPGGASPRTRVMSLDLAYHGDTLGAVSVGGIDLFHGTFGPLLFDRLSMPAPYCYRCPIGPDLTPDSCGLACAQEAVARITRHGDELAAVIVEPGLQGAGGMIVQPPGFLRAVAEATRRAGALLIADEVAVGFGRSADGMFACQTEGVTPDLLCLGKGLTGGYLPMAATLATERVFDAFRGAPEEGRTFFHGHTFTGNALAAAAGLATLSIFEDEDVVAGLPAKAEVLDRELDRIRPMPGVGEVRRYGLAVGIELVADRATKTSFPSEERRGMRVCRHAVRSGVFLRPLGDVVVLMPPLSITDAEIVRLVDAVEAGIRSELADAT